MRQKKDEEHNQWDMMECNSVMVGKIMRERCARRPKAHETLKWSMHTLKGPYPSWLLPKKCYFAPLIHYVLSTFV